MLDSQLEIIQQARQFLLDVAPEEYTEVLKPHLASCAGAHMRHILDHYIALKSGTAEGLVDYNKRNRFSNVESDPQAALAVWAEIETWLEQACELAYDTPLQVISETSIQNTEYVQVPSTLARELVFVSSHAIHHFSLLAVICSLQQKQTPHNFGVAPATATFLRQQA